MKSSLILLGAICAFVQSAVLPSSKWELNTFGFSELTNNSSKAEISTRTVPGWWGSIAKSDDTGDEPVASRDENMPYIGWKADTKSDDMSSEPPTT